VPYLRLFAFGAVGLALAWLPMFHGSMAGGAMALTCLVIGAALCTPAVVVFIRRATVGAVEALLGLPARLGLDYVERTLGRSTVNVLALMVAVSMSVSVGGWLSSFERSLGSWFEQMSAADLSVTAGSPLIDRKHVVLSPTAPERIAALPGVARVQPFRLVDQEVRGKIFRIVATDTDAFLSEATRRGKSWPVVDGAPLAEGDLSSGPRILLGESAARRLGLRAGDRFALHSPKGDVEFLVRAVIVDYTSQRGAGFIDRKQYLEHWGDDAVDAVSVYVGKGSSVDAVADGVRQVLGGGQSVFVTKTETLRENLLDSLHSTFSYSRSVELVTLLISLMGVIGTMVAAVLDRTREIGMLRAIGATSRQVAVAIVVEAGFLGFCAVIAGVGLGVLECLLFLKTLLIQDTGWHLDFVFPWAATARIGGLVVATSALAGGLPAWRASRADVTSAVLYE
jgi:putative ABC transport system permease protein